jgi:hypothetical protein
MIVVVVAAAVAVAGVVTCAVRLGSLIQIID